MSARTLFPALVLIFAMLACNFPSNVPVTETPTLAISPTFTQILLTDLPTQTPPPTNTPPPTTVPTSTIPIVSPKDVNVNCRLGPSVEWLPVSALIVGQTSQIIGKSADGGWWNITDPQNSSRRCWVSSSVVNTSGNLTAIPVAQAPEASVTNVAVNVDPKTISVTGCSGTILPIKIKGTIETNGPTTVKWRFETQLGGTLGDQTTDFDTFGSKDFTADYTPPLTAGTYWVRLVVVNPDNLQAETSYKLECPAT